MPKHSVAKAYKSWLQALEDMRAALTANPLLADPFMATAQVFEDIGRVMFASHAEPKKRTGKRAKTKRAPARKKTTARKRKH